MDVSGVGLIVALALRQAGLPAQPALPVSIERIQKELKKTPPVEPGQPVETEDQRLRIRVTDEQLRIRVTIEAHPLRLGAPWDPANDTAVPNYVRTARPLYHHEFLLAVTPEAFRAGALYPIAINVRPVVERGVRAIQDALRRREVARVRREVQEELRRFLEALEQRKKEEEKKKKEPPRPPSEMGAAAAARAPSPQP